MERSTALQLFGELEGEHDTEFEGDPPTYDVRLDASSGRDDPPPLSPSNPPFSRFYRLRVTASRGSGGFSRDSLLYVLERAGEHGVEYVDVANNGIELY